MDELQSRVEAFLANFAHALENNAPRTLAELEELKYLFDQIKAPPAAEAKRPAQWPTKAKA